MAKSSEKPTSNSVLNNTNFSQCNKTTGGGTSGVVQWLNGNKD